MSWEASAVVRDGHGPQIDLTVKVLLRERREHDGIVEVGVIVEDDGPRRSAGNVASRCRKRPGGEFLAHPVLLHAERACVDFASWVGGAFVWRKPEFSFTAAEQRTLTLALRGYRDEQIAYICGVSLSTVKKRWDAIFTRAFPLSNARVEAPGKRDARNGAIC